MNTGGRRLRFLLFFTILIIDTLMIAFPLSAQRLSLDETLRRLGSAGGEAAKLSWDSLFNRGKFSLAGHQGVFYAGRAGERGMMLFDNEEIFNVPLPNLERGSLLFPEAFVATLKSALEKAINGETDPFRIAAIIVDPGHGGKDSGATGNHTVNGRQMKAVEKDIVLQVSLDLYERLRAAYPDKRILLTREGDTFPSLEDRVNIANSVRLQDNEAIIYISVHANASLNRTARGYEVWYLSPEYRRDVVSRDHYDADVAAIINSMTEEEFTAESIMIAQSILAQFQRTLGNDIPSRGIKAEEWFVVRNTRMPAVLVELGFVTNEEDAKLLTDAAYLKKFSEALYKGMADFVTAFERSGGFTSAQ
ncbi:N-acetylmuramoyl-L-alanine amidase [Spirochaetia bacterium]|nr:N-acetylmuramoyl-L-alanine amidase [Spirochaetia bacterium]